MPTIVRFHELGGPEVLNIEEAPLQQPGKSEVRLRVEAAGLNRAEALYLLGQYLRSRSCRRASATRLQALLKQLAKASIPVGSARGLPRFQRMA